MSTQTGQALDAVTTYAASGTQPSSSLGRQALTDGVLTYGNGFAVTMIITPVLMLVVGGLGGVPLERHH